MLQSRLTRFAFAAAAALIFTACGDDLANEFKPVERLERTGATAIDQAGELACGADASTLRTALEVYEIREGEPAPDEAALVAEQYIREESELWDVRDGRLVPQDPGCGDVPAEVPAQEIVTEDEPLAGDEAADLAAEVAAMTPDDVLADATADEIAEVGGRDCAYEVAEVGLAFARWTFDRRAEPTSLEQLVADGYLGPLDKWTLTDTSLEAIPGTSCVGPFEMLSSGPAETCRIDARVLETARDAYLALFPDAAEPTQQDLLDVDLIREIGDRVDLVDGTVVPVAGGACDGVDLSDAVTPANPVEPSAAECDTKRTTFEVAVEVYFAQFGMPPASEADLVTGEILRGESPLFDVLPDGQVVPAPGGGCE